MIEIPANIKEKARKLIDGGSVSRETISKTVVSSSARLIELYDGSVWKTFSAD